MAYRDFVVETYKETIKKTSQAMEKNRKPYAENKMPRLYLLELSGDTAIRDFKRVCEERDLVISKVVRTMLREFTEEFNNLPPEERF